MERRGKETTVNRLRPRTLTLVIAVLAASLLPASVALAQPELTLVWPPSGVQIHASGSGVKVEVEGFQLDCSAIGGVPFPGRGHYHVLVDGLINAEGCESRTNFSGVLTQASHTIEVELVQNDHTPLSPRVTASARVFAYHEESVPFDPPSMVVTGVARTAGAVGSFFKTTFWAVAPSASTQSTFQMQFIPAPGQPPADFPVISVTIPGGSAFAFADLLRDAFGVTGGSFGNVMISGSPGTVTPVVAARTFNDQRDAQKGTFGQFIPAISIAGAGNPGTIQIDGLAANSQFRTNVGVLNLDLVNPLSATIDIYDETGVKRGAPISVQVPAGSLVQSNAVGLDLGLEPFSVKITSAGKFSAYASKLDNITSDPIFVTDAASNATLQVIDGVGSLQGGNNTFFKSELSLTNRRNSESTTVVGFVPRGSATPVDSIDVDLAPGQSVFFSNVVEELFELDGVAGALTLQSSEPVVAWARTYNDLAEGDGEGTFGQFIPAFSATHLIGLSGAILPGISQNTAVRTNAGLVNAGFANASATVSVWNAAGTKLAEKTYPVPAGQALFIGQVVVDVGAASLSDGYIKVVPSVAGAIYAWASSVDNVSTDQTFFRPFRLD